MARRQWFDIEKHEAQTAKKFARTDQAPIDGQYWITRRVSLPGRQFHHLFGVNFRHLTVEGAVAEAQKRASNHPGEIWGVFEFTGLLFPADPSNLTEADEMTEAASVDGR